MKQFYSNGKLLLSGEYLILDGAKGLALPTKYGQNLEVEQTDQPIINWESYDHHKNLWFHCIFQLPNLEFTASSPHQAIAQTLFIILKEAQKLNPEFLNNKMGFHIKTYLDFPNNWGLGTSSTLINNVAQWAKINAFDLLYHSFSGSGYDIACAENNSPIIFQLKEKQAIVSPVNFNPDFKDQLYFVHLNKKQNSRTGIERYRANKKDVDAVAEEISLLTDHILKTTHLADFEHLIAAHENIIAKIIQQEPVQLVLFSDYFGQTKSLGAWGGDFILATGNNDSPSYFKNKGFDTIIPYQEMILDIEQAK